MNALASDQALRIARWIHGNPRLQGIRAGLFVGHGEARPKKGTPDATVHKTMGPDHVITDHHTLRLSPPDILLTNYKMLDFLLLRPGDRGLWQGSTTGSLRFLVVDELHTFDGAQGTDLACLIRRLKRRLRISKGKLCCVGTSATLGGGSQRPGDDGDPVAALRHYAEDVFGEPFPDDAVIGETRQSPEQFLAAGDPGFAVPAPRWPESGDLAALDPCENADVGAYLARQAELWFSGPLTAEPGSRAWRVALGEALRRHPTLVALLSRLQGRPRALDELLRELPELGGAGQGNLARLAMTSLLSLVSAARTWREEQPAAREAREAKREERPVDALLQVRLQLWVRELGRMVGSLDIRPRLRFHDDLTPALQQRHLPVIHCRQCGAMGWATLALRDRRHQHAIEVSAFYQAFFGRDPRVRFLFPAEAVEASGDREAPVWARTAERLRIHRETLMTVSDDDDETPENLVAEVVIPDCTRSVQGGQELVRDCPFCGASEVLTIVGFRAASLTSVFIDQLFASPYNRDKKLLTFSDSVQDAAHRAGFFGSRTWRFSLRAAIQKFLHAADGGGARADGSMPELTLADFPARFSAWWRGPGGLNAVGYVGRFLPPSMEWLADYTYLKENGELREGSDLVTLIDRRIAWELAVEYGLQSRIGRSLPRTRASIAFVNPTRFAAAVDLLVEPLRNEVGGMRGLTRPVLAVYLAGVLLHLLEGGGVLSTELPDGYVTAGGNEFVFTRIPHLPSYGKRSRLPALLTDHPRTKRFDFVMTSGASSDWHQRWLDQCFGQLGVLTGDVGSVMQVVLPALVRHQVLEQRALERDGSAWGLRPDALLVSCAVRLLRCGRCGYTTAVPAHEEALWTGSPCLTARCGGVNAVTPDTGADYFGRLLRSGDLERIVAAEHTGLLEREERERVEQEFKAKESERLPWYPNLLSCTPTLEMGIDIGDLSTAFLCSVPPAQANYLQRIGRAGRRDGNALVVTVANRNDHDLYFYAAPEEMLAGAVATPGVYLDASAVLERQLVAFCLDRWVEEGGATENSFPRKIDKVLTGLNGEKRDRFPYPFLRFVQDSQRELEEGFLGLFDRLGDATRQRLQGFVRGGEGAEEGLAWRVMDALTAQQKSRKHLQGQANRITDILRAKEQGPVQDSSLEEELEQLRQERDALRALIEQLDRRDTLNVLTDEGIVPNYAFPEAAIRLRSVIWRRRQEFERGKGRYRTWSYEYGRPAAQALAELAPDSTFFAGGRQVVVDQVDLALSELEAWRFCDDCSHCRPERDVTETEPECPVCASPGWVDSGQVQQLLRLRQVFANTSEKESRIGDESDRRAPTFYARRTLVVVRPQDRAGGWRIAAEEIPFAFELLRRATFREVNFGEQSDVGPRVLIGGEAAVRQGFAICRHCGKVQPRGANAGPVHSFTCTARDKRSATNLAPCIYLYREFTSEAIRFLLPLMDVDVPRQLHSFVAALRLGLEDYFRGRVDHLQTTIDSEPIRDTTVRRQFLVLFDTVPGGTGYLETLVREPDTIFELLARARARLLTCVCASDPTRDGCYRCLFAYRDRGQLTETSRRAAIELLGRILEHRADLARVETLSEVAMTGLMDSLLEARFIEAIRRSDAPGRPVSVTKALVAGKPGFRVQVGDRTWTIEPQRTLAPTDGVGLDVSIDFVLEPTRPEPGVRPIAIFLDGWRYHQARVGKDSVQRLALLASKRYDVWSFTWHDIERLVSARAPAHEVPSLCLNDRDTLLRILGAYGLASLVPSLQQTSFEWFLDTLAGRYPWADAHRLAYAALFSQLVPPNATELARWEEEVRARAPAVAVDDLLDGGSDDLVGRWPAAAELPVTVHLRASRAAIVSDKAVFPLAETRALRLLVCLEDDGADAGEPGLRRAWWSLLRLFNFVRALPRIWFVSRRTVAAEAYSVVAGLRTRPAAASIDGEGEAAWRDVADTTRPEFQPLLQTLREAGVPPPEVGVDLPTAAGHASGAQAELAWQERRVAVITAGELGRATKPLADGWTVFSIDALGDPAPLLAALTNKHGGAA
jgi:DEAD/DEAH box helicase domain-containing protein